MNIEETQRVNKLAKELLSHGMAASSQDAYAKAEKMIIGDKPKGQKTLGDNFEKAKAEQASELQLLKSSLQQLTKDMLRISSSVRALTNSFNHLKEEFSTMKGQQMKQTSQPRQDTNTIPNNTAATQESTAESKDMQHNTKSSYPQKDVAIDKIFYFGKK